MDQPKTNYSKTHPISTLDKFPANAHYAVLIQSQRSYPDPYEDTNRGGTATITDNILEYCWFEDQEALNAWVLDEAKSTYKKKYKVIKVNPVEVELHTTMRIKE
jgi:hypothetical protein